MGQRFQLLRKVYINTMFVELLIGLISVDHFGFFFSSYYNAATAKSLQSCLILCDPMDGSPPGSPVPGILQARTLEWVAISFSNA